MKKTLYRMFNFIDDVRDKVKIIMKSVADFINGINVIVFRYIKGLIK